MGVRMKLTNILLLIFMVFFFGCATPQIITLKDGREITTPDKVEFDKESGFYQFEDQSGKEKSVNKDEVLSIEDK